MSISEPENSEKYLLAIASGVLLSLVMHPFASCLAEVHNCNGVLTNKTCEELAAPKPLPTRSVQVSQEAVLRGKKKLLLHDLRTKLLNERRKSGVDLDISEAEEVCNGASTSLPDCRKVVSSLDEALDSRITNSRLVKSAEESKKVPAVTPAAVSNVGGQNQVIIVQQVGATPTPLLVYDLGGLIPVERRPGRRPGAGSTGHKHRPLQEPPIHPGVTRDPGVTGGTTDTSSVRPPPAKNSKGK